MSFVEPPPSHVKARKPFPIIATLALALVAGWWCWNRYSEFRRVQDLKASLPGKVRTLYDTLIKHGSKGLPPNTNPMLRQCAATEEALSGPVLSYRIEKVDVRRKGRYWRVDCTVVRKSGTKGEYVSGNPWDEFLFRVD